MEFHGHCQAYAPQRMKPNRLTSAPNEDSDQPAHPRMLIRVFVVLMKKLCILGYPKAANAQADLNRHENTPK